MAKSPSSRSKNPPCAQVTLEFMFAVLIVVLLAIGMIRVFQWAGEDVFRRRSEHEWSLRQGNNPRAQLQDDFFTSVDINATVDSNIFGDNP